MEKTHQDNMKQQRNGIHQDRGLEKSMSCPFIKVYDVVKINTFFIQLFCRLQKLLLEFTSR